MLLPCKARQQVRDGEKAERNAHEQRALDCFGHKPYARISTTGRQDQIDKRDVMVSAPSLLLAVECVSQLRGPL